MQSEEKNSVEGWTESDCQNICSLLKCILDVEGQSHQQANSNESTENRKGIPNPISEQMSELISLFTVLALEDKFSLKESFKMRTHIRRLVNIDHQDYSSIVPLLFAASAVRRIREGESVEKINAGFLETVELFGDRHARKWEEKPIQTQKVVVPQEICYSPKVDMFEPTGSVHSWPELVEAIKEVALRAEKTLPLLEQLMGEIGSGGMNAKSNLKLPLGSDKQNQLRVVLRVTEKMFKHLRDSADSMKKLFTRVQSNKSHSLESLGKALIEVWMELVREEITRKSGQKERVEFKITDMVRANCYFNCQKQFEQAVHCLIQKCQEKSYSIAEISQRVSRGSNETVFVIIIAGVMAEIQLIKVPEGEQVDIGARQFIHSLYQIRRSPTGCLLGSYLSLLKCKSTPKILNVLNELRKNSTELEDFFRLYPSLRNSVEVVSSGLIY